MPQPVCHQTRTQFLLDSDDKIFFIDQDCWKKLEEHSCLSNKQTECIESYSGAQCLNRLLSGERAEDDASSWAGLHMEEKAH